MNIIIGLILILLSSVNSLQDYTGVRLMSDNCRGEVCLATPTSAGFFFILGFGVLVFLFISYSVKSYKKNPHKTKKFLLILLAIIILIVAIFHFLPADKKCGLIRDSESRDNCFNQTAQEQTNLKICDSIQKASLKDYCTILIKVKTGTPAICENLTSQTQKNYCYWSFAISENKLSLCDNLSTVRYQSYCKARMEAGLAF